MEKKKKKKKKTAARNGVYPLPHQIRCGGLKASVHHSVLFLIVWLAMAITQVTSRASRGAGKQHAQPGLSVAAPDPSVQGPWDSITH